MLRLLALAATLGIFGAAYAIFPEYQGDFYAPFWKFLRTIAYAVPLIPVYLVWSDTRLRDPRDELLELGLLLTGHAREVDYALIRRHFMGWAVKGFFTPLMTVYLSQEVQYLCTAFRGATGESWQNYDLWFHLSYGIDLLFCVVGYTATLRLFDSHIRSVEPTALGWGAALICYQPFYSIVGSMYLKYESGYHWDRWLGDWPHVQDAWGVAIILVAPFTWPLPPRSAGGDAWAMRSSAHAVSNLLLAAWVLGLGDWGAVVTPASVRDPSLPPLHGILGKKDKMPRKVWHNVLMGQAAAIPVVSPPPFIFDWREIERGLPLSTLEEFSAYSGIAVKDLLEVVIPAADAEAPAAAQEPLNLDESDRLARVATNVRAGGKGLWRSRRRQRWLCGKKRRFDEKSALAMLNRKPANAL